jgi:hypothetical protein
MQILLKVKSYFDIFEELNLKVWDFVRTKTYLTPKKLLDLLASIQNVIK